MCKIHTFLVTVICSCNKEHNHLQKYFAPCVYTMFESSFISSLFLSYHQVCAVCKQHLLSHRLLAKTFRSMCTHRAQKLLYIESLIISYHSSFLIASLKQMCAVCNQQRTFLVTAICSWKEHNRSQKYFAPCVYTAFESCSVLSRSTTGFRVSK